MLEGDTNITIVFQCLVPDVLATGLKAKLSRFEYLNTI
jgi:hypothetical protein